MASRFGLLLIAAATLIASAFCPSRTAAQAGDGLPWRIVGDRWYVSAGGFLVDFNTEASVGLAGGLGSLIRVEDDLGVDENKSTFRVDARYRFRPNHTLEFGLFLLDRTGSSAISETIEFQDLVFDVGAAIASRFETDLYGAAYRYSFINDGRTEAGLLGGLSIYRFRFGVEGQARVGGQTAEFEEAADEILAPIPVVGIFVDHAFSPKFVMRSGASFFRISIGDFSGRLVETRLAFDYFFWKKVSVGTGIASSSVDVQTTGDDAFAVSYFQTGLLFNAGIAF
jgi:hypothetical protein